MFVLNPDHRSFFQFQLKHVLYNLWLNEFDCEIQVSSIDRIKARGSRMGIRGNRYNNYSELIIKSNKNSTSSMWLTEHDVFQQDDRLIYEKVRQAVVTRANLSLKDHDVLLAKSFVRALKRLPMLDKETLPDVFWDKPFSAAIHSLSQPLSNVYGIFTSRKDDVDPEYDWDGHVCVDDSSYYSLLGNFEFIRGNYDDNISPYFCLEDDAEDFFIEYGRLYCEYLIHVEAREVDNSLSKISNLDNIANSMYISPKRFS